jgi:manganese transport protein
LAFFVNAAILILAAATFFTSGHTQVASLQDAHQLLAPLLGSKWASHLFAIALIAAGQSSTITGTLAGQIVMEGYLRLRISPMVRRLITRLLAIVPALIIMLIMGEKMVDSMLIFSQVLLSMQLAFAVIPLIHFVSDKKRMTVFVIKPYVQVIAWVIALLLIVLNLKLVYESGIEWMSMTNSLWVKAWIELGEIGLLLMLFITTFYPLMVKRKERSIDMHTDTPLDIWSIKALPFARIALALDYGDKDQKVIQYALQLANSNTQFILIHIVESAPARMLGNEAQDYETIKDKQQLDNYVQLFTERKLDAQAVLGFKNRAKEIARIVQDNDCDLLILGSHGHRDFKDWLLGETINTVQHLVHVPVFIAK